MQKLTLAEIGNPKNTITMMVDDKIGYGYSVEDLLSPAQMQKFEKFENSCKFGWYSVYGPKCSVVRYGNIYIDKTEDETGRFKAGHRVYVMPDAYLVEYLTNIQGQRDMIYIIPKSEVGYECVCPQAAYRAIELCYPERAIWKGDKIY